MTDKFIGDPLRPRAPWQKEAVPVVSANVNADGKVPEPKPPGERVIGDPDRRRAPWQKEPTRLTPGD